MLRRREGLFFEAHNVVVVVVVAALALNGRATAVGGARGRLFVRPSNLFGAGPRGRRVRPAVTVEEGSTHRRPRVQDN